MKGVCIRNTSVLFALCALLLISAVAHGQTGWGELKGFITDGNGAAIVGATIKVTSNALMGERQSVSGERGYYRVINLPPGRYKVVVSKENYRTKELANISIRAEKTSSYNFVLEIGSFEETIVITGDVPVIDTEATGQSYQIEGELQRGLPLNERSNYHEIMRLIPGVVMTYNVDAVYSYYSVHGSDPYSSNNWQLDGASAASWHSGFGGSTHVNMDIVEDASVQVSGLTAAAPMGQGATINFVTKSGGNDLSGSATLQWQPKKWNDTNIEGGTPNDADFLQPSFSLGGPFVQDRFWWFASHRYTKMLQGISRSESLVADLRDTFPGWEPFDIDKKLHTFFAKSTFLINDTNQVFVSYQRDWGPETFGGGNRTKAALIDEESGGPFYMGSWTTAIGDNLSVTTSVSYREKPRKRSGRPGNESDPAITVSRSWFFSSWSQSWVPSQVIGYDGNYRSIYEITSKNWEVKSDAEYFLEDLYGSHELEAGVYAQPNSSSQSVHDKSRDPLFEYRTPIDLNDYSKGTRVWGRVTSLGDEQEYEGVVASNYAVYLNDTWKPTKRLTVNLGLRLDYVDNDSELVGNRIDVNTMTALTPILGFTYSITEDGANILRAGYRRSNEAFRSDILFRAGQSNFVGELHEFDFDGDGIFETVINKPASTTAAEDFNYGDVSIPYSNDFNIGYTREFPWDLTVSFDYIYRQFKNAIYDLDVNPIFQNNQFVGMTDPTKDEIIVYTNNTWSHREYHGIDVTVNKRFSNNFQFIGAFSQEWMDAKGEFAPDDPYRYISPEKFDHYDITFGTGGGGRNPRGPNLRFNAVWNSPYYGLNFSVSTIHNAGGLSGTVYHDLPSTDPEVTRFGPRTMIQDGHTIINPLYTTRRIYFSDRKEGQWRAPMNHKVNIRVGKEFRLAQYRIETAIDIFNVFNFDSERYTHYSGRNYGAVNYRTGEKYYGTNYSIQAPRAAQFYVRFSF